MTDGIGVDIIEIARIRQALAKNPRFAQRHFTAWEREFCQSRRDRARPFAARFAAKEAVAKALGHSLSWLEVEVRNDPRGKPVIVLYGRAKELAAGRRLLVSLSHSLHYAVACALLVAPETGEEAQA
jgi:holo-[acyl-carrier-protein] synthase